MPFEDITPVIGPRADAGPAVYVRVSAHTKPAGHSITVALTLPMVEQLGWKPGERLAMAAGTGADAGRLRINKALSGGFKLSGKPNGRVLQVVSRSLHPSWRREAIARQQCSTVPGLAPGVLVVILPAQMLGHREG